MKTTLRLLSIAMLFSCGNTEQKKAETFYGEKINSEDVQDYSELKLEVAKNGVTTAMVEGEIIETCAKKGCWMTMKVKEDTLMVRFKDYGFFMPKEGANGKTAIISGDAFFDTLSVELLQHYAEDAGKPDEEILSITEPEYVVAFTANGVIIQD
jgi:hypothetical protein